MQAQEMATLSTEMEAWTDPCRTPQASSDEFWAALFLRVERWVWDGLEGSLPGKRGGLELGEKEQTGAL